MLSNMNYGSGEVRQSEGLAFDILNQIIQIKRVQTGRFKDGLSADLYLFGKSECLSFCLLAVTIPRPPHLGEMERLQEILTEVKKMQNEKKTHGLNLGNEPEPDKESIWKGYLAGFDTAVDTINRWVGNPQPQGFDPRDN